MSGLPTQIPPQSEAIGTVDSKPVTLNLNWWLLLYNLTQQIFGTGVASTPASPYDILDQANLLAQGADILQAYRRIENLAAQLSMQSLADGADLARVKHDLANAMTLALMPPLPAQVHQAQAAQTITLGASPLTFTALRNGALAVSAGTVSAISIIRQGTTVATGNTAGLIPVRRLDEVKITYTSTPTVVFLPD